MKPDTLKNELKYDGYSKEEQYFYELNLKLKNELNDEKNKSELKPKVETKVIRLQERAIERWETDGGKVAKK